MVLLHIYYTLYTSHARYNIMNILLIPFRISFVCFDMHSIFWLAEIAEANQLYCNIEHFFFWKIIWYANEFYFMDSW